MQKGTVKWFNKEKGYGFIAGETDDYFVHCTNIESDELEVFKTGQNVCFDIKETDKGIMAINVKMLMA